MKQQSRSMASPAAMVHHIREIQLRLLATVAVLLGGMAIGYVFYKPLFEFIKAPLVGPLHYMSPAGSFTFIVKICLIVGIIIALPVAIYNIIMFIQPALDKHLSRLRVYATTFSSLLLAGSGAAFGYFVILPLALRFFYKFQISGLEAIISADEYLRFVAGIIITFVIIFQLPLLISFADHIHPLHPKKLLKAEKYIIVGSIFIGVVVPFALDPTVQLLIASPIIVLYNVSILVVLVQHATSKHRVKKQAYRSTTPPTPAKETAPQDAASLLAPKPEPAPTMVAPPSHQAKPNAKSIRNIHIASPPPHAQRAIDGTIIRPPRASPHVPSRQPARLLRPVRPRSLQQSSTRRLVVMDIHPTSSSDRPMTRPRPAIN